MLETYSDPDTPEYNAMVEEIRKELNFTSLRFNRLDDMLQAIGLDSDKICTYCLMVKIIRKEISVFFKIYLIAF